MVFINYLFTLFSSASLVRIVLATTGTATWSDPGLGTCGFKNNSWDVTSLNSGDYDDGKNCGRTVRVYYQRRAIDVQVVDECTECPPGGMDLSQPAFEFLAGDLRKGSISIEWEFF